MRHYNCDIVFGSAAKTWNNGKRELIYSYELKDNIKIIDREMKLPLMASLFDSGRLTEIGLLPNAHMGVYAAVFSTDVVRGIMFPEQLKVEEDRIFNYLAIYNSASIAITGMC